MAEKTPRLYLEHIREAIGLIEQYIRGGQRQDLDREPMLRQAIERNIEIISEASRHVPQAMKARHPEVPFSAPGLFARSLSDSPARTFYLEANEIRR